MKDFQAEAQEALGEETPNSSRLERLMESSASLDVDLPELPKLKQVGKPHVGNNGLVHCRGNSNAFSMEVPQSCTKPSIYRWASVRKT